MSEKLMRLEKETGTGHLQVHRVEFDLHYSSIYELFKHRELET